MSAQEKRDSAYRLVRSFYAKRAPWQIVRRAERLYHRLACEAFVAKHAKTGSTV